MKRSFGLWLMTVFMVSIVLPLILLTTVLTVVFRVMFNQQTEYMFTTTLHATSANLSMYTEDLGRLSMTPYYNGDMLTHLRNMDAGKYNVDMPATRGINADYHNSLSQQLGTVRNDVIGVLFVPINEEVDQSFLVRRYAGDLRVFNNLGAREEDWYKDAVAADGDLLFSSIGLPEYYGDGNFHFYTNADELNVFSIARLIKDPATMRPVGVLKVDAVDLVIKDIFHNLPIEEDSAVLLVDSGNNVIHASSAEQSALATHLVPGMGKLEAGGHHYTVYSANIGGTPWRLYYLASERGIRTQTATLLLVALGLGAISFGIAVVLFRVNSKRTVANMQRVVTGLGQIADGNLDARIQPEEAGTLAPVAEAMNRTAERLEEHIDREYRATLSQRNAEYLALQSQINPHFLNNVLGGFVTLNQVGDRDTLEQSILRLSHLFRYTSKNEDIATLREELTFLEEYLALQKLRFSHRISCRIRCEEAAYGIALPKLLLQPLVENSIIHGMEPYDGEMQVDVGISITGEGDARRLEIVVNDDGGGFEPEDIGPDSVGLRNIRERLQLYRQGADLTVTSARGAGCCCRIVLPLEEGEGHENSTV